MKTMRKVGGRERGEGEGKEKGEGEGKVVYLFSV